MNTTTTVTPIQTVTLGNGLTVAYRDLGDGPPVLLLHGWPTSSLLWRSVMPAIATRNRVVALDMPGFGASDKPLDVRYDFELFERVIDEFLAAVGVDDVAVAGHDLGGPIAVHWALANPARARRLALLNTLLYPEFSDAVIDFVRSLRTPEHRAEMTSPDGLAELLRLGVADPGVLTDEVIVGVVAPFPDDESRLALARAGYQLGLRGFTEIAAGLGSLTCPVRVVYGVLDEVLPDVADTFDRLQRDVPHAWITALPDAGHFVTEDAPAEVAALLAAFFAAE